MATLSFSDLFTTTKPFNISSCNSNATNSSKLNNTCQLTDPYCTLRDPSHALDGLGEECILWDSTCCGNTSAAAEKFWGDGIARITSNSCFRDPSPICTKQNPPGRMGVFANLKKWMRTPECYNAEGQAEMDPNRAMFYENMKYLNSTCCNDCNLGADRVDVYYWPDPNGDTSCLSIVGDETHDVAAGGTTDDEGVYWGCTSTNMAATLGVQNIDTLTTFKTATLTTIASITFKTYLMNPWDGTPCDNASASSSFSMSSNQTYHTPKALLPRANSLVVNDSKVSTLVMDGFTL